MPPNNIVSKIGDRRGGLHIRPCPAASNHRGHDHNALGFGRIYNPPLQLQSHRTSRHKKTPLSPRDKGVILCGTTLIAGIPAPRRRVTAASVPVYCPKGSAGSSEAMLLHGAPPASTTRRLSEGADRRILVLVIAFFRYLPYNTPFSGICQARKRKLSHMRLCP